MGERRALLDPEMYKISEEDSQDEEVLASYTEDALKLGGVGGGGGPDDISNGNVAGGRHSRSSWNTRRDQHHDVDVDFWNYTGSSSSQFTPSKLRFVQQQQHGLSSNKYNYHGKTSIVSGGVRVVTNNSTGKSIDDNQHFSSRHHSHEYDNNVDWPESSTNSDSYVSGDDKRGDRSAISNNTASNSSTTKITFNAIDNEKFLSKTYFGDHMRHRRGVGEGAENDEDSRDYPLVRSQHTPASSSSTQQQQQVQSENSHCRPKQFQKRSSRRPLHGNRNVNESTSGSDCSDDGDGSSSSSCGSACEDCLRATNGGEHHRRHHGRGGRRHVNSSSEVEEYDSSYSDESSYDDEDGEGDDDDYEDYYDEDEENECFDDIVKFL